jgi:Protein of unknown function (DUF3309)
VPGTARIKLGPEFQPAGANPRKSISRQQPEVCSMSLGAILLIVFIIILIGALPSWPYSSGWGYYPSGGAGLVLLIVVILLLMGRI